MHIFFFLSSFYSFSFLLSCRISPSFFSLLFIYFYFWSLFSPHYLFHFFCLYLSLLSPTLMLLFLFLLIRHYFLFLISILFVISFSHSLHPISLHFLESIFLQKLLPFLIAEYCFFFQSPIFIIPLLYISFVQNEICWSINFNIEMQLMMSFL